jgi:hypothetical protein
MAPYSRATTYSKFSQFQAVAYPHVGERFSRVTSDEMPVWPLANTPAIDVALRQKKCRT